MVKMKSSLIDMVGRNKHTRTIEEDARLIEALLELRVCGKYDGADNGLKPGYLKAVQQLLDDRAIVHGATDLGENVTKQTQRNSPFDMEGLEEIVEEMQQTSHVNCKRKRPPTDDMESSYKKAVKEMKECFKEVGRQENKEACDMIDKVIEDVQHMPNINVKQRIKVINMFSKHQFHARAFFKMTEEEKICYMEY
uniref:Uncharacterized protein n=1 Tax=Lactuca sativa TaxID=4236 RepID=A0A9R1X0P9_LACSA|nr:hypothetical protein LSAT_V11C800416080 [Lactuca sativa]